MPASADHHVSRRAVLAGGATLLILGACSSNNGGSSSGGNGSKSNSLVSFTPGETLAPGSPQRITLGIANSEGVILRDAPNTLSVRVTKDGKLVGRPIQVRFHNDGLPRGYYPLIFTPPATGVYEANVRFRGDEITSAFQVFEPSRITVLGAGAAMPSLATPTTADAQGVDPICTRSPACPFHDTSLDAALAERKPLVFLVATPRFCQTAICGPVVDVLMSQQSTWRNRVTIIHNEVYRSAAQASQDVGNAPLTPAVEALHLSFEPSLYLVQPDGKIFRRVDTIYDAAELRRHVDDLLTA